MTFKIKVKRGDTFARLVQLVDNGAPVDITDWTIASQLRYQNGTLLAQLAVGIVDAVNGRFSLTFADTTAWPVQAFNSDIQFTSAGATIASTETFVVQVIQDITQ